VSDRPPSPFPSSASYPGAFNRGEHVVLSNDVDHCLMLVSEGKPPLFRRVALAWAVLRYRRLRG
jgi:hypothetical protein